MNTEAEIHFCEQCGINVASFSEHMQMWLCSEKCITKATIRLDGGSNATEDIE